MQFLQKGLEENDECLFVSTEQTDEELEDSFSPFGFNLEHDNLSITSLHATHGHTLESDERGLVLETLNGNELGFGVDVPFSVEYVTQYLQGFGGFDRVAFDSASGLRLISENDEVYRRAVIDLIRLFNDEMDATAVFTAEDTGGDIDEADNPLQFTTHGTIRMWHELVEEDPHTYLRVNKMRGTDHDRRRVEVRFGESGIRLAPARRSQPPELKQHKHLPVGVEGLDMLCGGGIVCGASTLIRHDGRANLASVLGTLLSTAVENGYVIVLTPTVHITPGRLETVVEEHGESIEDILDERRLFVFDMTGSWENEEHRNIIEPTDQTSVVKSTLQEINENVGSSVFSLTNTGATVHRLGPGGAREMQYFVDAHLGPEDVNVNVHNPSVTDSRISEFFLESAEQVIETHVKDDGLQYISLKKSPCGFVGTTSLVEFREEPPYFRVEEPPRERDNPMGLD